ncbi:MAG: hypothetical protein GXY33_03570 [Phycisphaerae bacterium]|nr:hypothetical protein [Phycisphaerae bacterium]
MSKQVLNGGWAIVRDRANVGRRDRWFDAIHEGCVDAVVPGIIQQTFPDYQGVVWYYRRFTVQNSPEPDQRTMLAFRAVDYLADVWVNGKHAGRHEGGETPFRFDITDLVGPQRENLIAVRVLCPDDEPIDGMTIANTPCRNCRSFKDFAPGSSLRIGGILQEVSLLGVRDKRIEDFYVRSDCRSGQTRVELTCRNDTRQAVSARITSTISDKLGDVHDRVDLEVELPPGESVHAFHLTVDSPRRWDLDDPFLYDVTATLIADGGEDTKTKRTGYREFCVKNGYFHLNGRRRFLKSSHTGNHFPIGQVVPTNIEFLRRDLYYAKAAGFNMIRFIAGMPLEEQLDFCDELGLMVYEENYAAWLLEDSPQMPQRFDSALREMVLRDRSHPSVTIWGMLNETGGGSVFDRAYEGLKLLRSLDQDRLVLLSSSRGECNPRIGSISNPGSDLWQYEWGMEAPDADFSRSAPESPAAWGAPYFLGYSPGMGDVHIYPRLPLSPRTREFLRTLGHDSKPILLSEFGAGSMMNVIGEYHRFQQNGASDKLVDMGCIRGLCEKLEADWRRFGMEKVYPVLEDMLIASQELQVRQREIGFDLIRANPKFCGYNMTGLLDHGITGEGAWDFWREFKPGIFDMLHKCHSPLQWCLFVPEEHVYSGRQFTVEAVLANEDVLRPGNYPVVLQIVSPHGDVLWEKRARAVVDASASPDSSLAIPVAKETVRISGGSGEYTFRAYMENGARPAGGKVKFHLTNPETFPRVESSVALMGIPREVEEFLSAHGAACRPLDAETIAANDVILIGDVSNMQIDRSVWEKLFDGVARGARAAFLCAASLGRLETPEVPNHREHAYQLDHILPIGEGRCFSSFDWLYHKECINKPHPIFEGLTRGMMDFVYYGPVVPTYVLDTPRVPDQVVAAAFAVAYCPDPDGYFSGVLVGSYRHGKGGYTISTMDILDNVNAHPAADRLLLNIVKFLAADRGRD